MQAKVGCRKRGCQHCWPGQVARAKADVRHVLELRQHTPHIRQPNTQRRIAAESQHSQRGGGGQCGRQATQRIVAEVEAGQPCQVMASREVVQAVAREAQGDERAASWQCRQGPAAGDIIRRELDAVAVQAERGERGCSGKGRGEVVQLAVPQVQLLQTCRAQGWATCSVLQRIKYAEIVLFRLVGRQMGRQAGRKAAGITRQRNQPCSACHYGQRWYG